MKTLRIFLISSLSILLIASSCNINCVDPIGPIVTDNRELDDFTGIHIKIPAEVKLVIGEKKGISIKSYESYIQATSAIISRNTLEVVGDVCKASPKDIVITLYANNIDDITISGSAHMFSDTPLQSDDLDMEINGSGSMSLKVFTKNIDASIVGSGVINLSGTTQRLDVGINGSGDLNGLGLNSYKAKVKINGSGKTHIVAHDRLSATIRGSGEINYSGNPQISTSISGSGTVNKIN